MGQRELVLMRENFSGSDKKLNHGKKAFMSTGGIY